MKIKPFLGGQMAEIKCPKCKNHFDSNNAKSVVTRSVAAAAGAGGGAAYGAGFGIAGGPLGAIAGTIPGALIGGVIGWFALDQFRKCPECGKIIKT
jgi:uncharacterized C2H2 Zn-finger protein